VKRKNDRTGSGGTAIVDTIINLDMGGFIDTKKSPVRIMGSTRTSK
jgi:hypothetical protein